MIYLRKFSVTISAAVLFFAGLAATILTPVTAVGQSATLTTTPTDLSNISIGQTIHVVVGFDSLDDPLRFGGLPDPLSGVQAIVEHAGLGSASNVTVAPDWCPSCVTLDPSLTTYLEIQAIGGVSHPTPLPYSGSLMEFDLLPNTPGSFTIGLQDSEIQVTWERIENQGQSYGGGSPLSVTVTPEPSTFILAAFGLLSVGITRRRRQRA